MPIKTYKPTTNNRRYIGVVDYSAELTKKAPEKALTKGIRSTGARNNVGRMTVRFRGGGNKRAYRQIDFARTKTGPAKVMAIEYDPNRSAFIALICYEDGTKSYILAPVGLKVGQVIASGSGVAP